MPSPLSNSTREILAPGRGLSEGARALQGTRRRLGTFPYQWMYPGPNAKHVRAAGTFAIVADPLAGAILSYDVPTGYRFSLRGIVLNSSSPVWEEGNGAIIFSVTVVNVGARTVDYLDAVDTRLGSSVQPFPLSSRLEFASLEQVVVGVSYNSLVGGNGGFCTAMLWGHIYPNSEAGDD